MRPLMRRTARRFWLAIPVGALLGPTLPSADVIQEQQARLPPPAQCADPVAGVWMSHAFYPHVSEWYVFTLTIARVPNDASALAGRIHAVFWSGNAQTAALPACGPGVDRRAVLEPARGSYDPNGRVLFEGTSWSPTPDGSCNPGAGIGYNLDHFTGTIDPARQEFQSVLNAPGWVDVPTVFRRIRCADGTAAPNTPAPPPAPPVVTPPRPAPPRTGGCGCGGPLGAT